MTALGHPPVPVGRGLPFLLDPVIGDDLFRGLTGNEFRNTASAIPCDAIDSNRAHDNASVSVARLILAARPEHMSPFFPLAVTLENMQWRCPSPSAPLDEELRERAGFASRRPSKERRWRLQLGHDTDDLRQPDGWRRFMTSGFRPALPPQISKLISGCTLGGSAAERPLSCFNSPRWLKRPRAGIWTGGRSSLSDGFR